MRRIGLAAMAAALLLVPLAVPLHATLTIPTDLPDVVSSATVIARGRVVDTRAFTEISNGPVMTAVTISISQIFKGSADATLTFRVHGGDMGRYRYRVIGSPIFSVGDEAYFFLRRSSTGALWPVAMSSGVYRVQPGAMPGGGSGGGDLRIGSDRTVGASRNTAAGGSATGVVTPPVVAGVTATAGAPIIRGDVRRGPMAAGEFEGIVKLLMTAGAPRVAGARGRK